MYTPQAQKMVPEMAKRTSQEKMIPLKGPYKTKRTTYGEKYCIEKTCKKRNKKSFVRKGAVKHLKTRQQ